MGNSLEQTIKGDGNSQQSIINQYNNCNFNVTEAQIIDIIKKHSFVNRDQLVDEIKEAISSIEQEHMKEPDKRIFVPLIQQLSYSLDDEYIKNTYKKLLQSSMNINKNPHPSFVNVISQLNSDEIKLLNCLEPSKPYPLIDIKEEVNSKGFLFILLNFTDIVFGVCKYPENVCSYIDNLERLKIIRISQLKIANREVYTKLEKHSSIQNILVDYKNTGFVEKTMMLTQFGIDFLNCCR